VRDMKADEIFRILKERLGAAILDEHPEGPEPWLAFDPASIEALARFARDDPRLRFDLLSLVSTVDWPPAAASADGKVPARPGSIEVVYLLDSTVHRHRLMAKARLDRDRPRIRTVEDIWPAADWHEREAWDLMGVVFEGHHNLVRILCAEDWEGHPLRKDYVIPGEYHGIKNVIY
jgi:NADH-quinone oxidoreductase subunit C